MAAVIDLKPDRDLLDPCFETYRLESKPLEVEAIKLQAPVRCGELNPGKFGLCHVQLQLKLNALITDDFNPGLVFYTSQEGLRRVTSITGASPGDPKSHVDTSVYKSPSLVGSVQFVSADHAVILEPLGTLILLHTGPRETSHRFENIFSSETGLQNGMLLNALELTSADKKSEIHLIICSIKDGEDGKRNLSCLDWLVLGDPATEASEKRNWCVIWRHQLYGKAVAKFTKILHNGLNPESLRLLICADCRYRPDPESDDSNKRDKVTSKSVPLYTYMQDETEVTVTFALAPGASKNDVRVIIRSHKIQFLKTLESVSQVEIKGEIVIDAKLHDDVDPACSVWCIADSRLEITLIKRTEARWARLLIDDDRGEEIFDPSYAAAVHDRLQHLTTTEQDTACASSLTDSDRGENCDEPPDEFHIELFNANEKSVRRVSCADMTGREHIMDMRSREGLELVLRHDVDGLVWQFAVESDGSVRAKHIHTVSAFGYVVASKRDKVLLTGCLEAGHSALVDAKNNVFIYEHQIQGKPKKTVLKEYVLPLSPGANHVIGGQMLVDELLLLTSDTLFAIGLPK